MGAAERQQFPLSGPMMYLVVTVLVMVVVSSTAAGESVDATLDDFAPPIMNAHLAECYETLLRNTDRLCAEATDQRNKVLTSALSKCLFGRVGLWKTEQCHHDTSSASNSEDLTDAHGSGSPECRQLKTYKSSSVYGTVLTSLLSVCALKEFTQQMVEVTVVRAIASKSDSILPAEDLENLLRLTQRVDAVYALVLEHSSWINMMFYYCGLASLLTIITKHPSNQHGRWQQFGIFIFTIIAEKFLCPIVLLVVDVYSSKMVLNLVQWTVRYAGLATTAIFLVRSFSSNLSFSHPPKTALVSIARDQVTDLVPADTEQWGSGAANESTSNFVIVRVPDTAMVSLVHLLRMFPGAAMFRDPNVSLLNHAAEQVAISAAQPAVILAANPATVLGTNPAIISDNNPAIISDTNPAIVSHTNPTIVLGTNPVISDTNPSIASDTNPVAVSDANPAIVLSTNPAAILSVKPAKMIHVNPAAIVPSSSDTNAGATRGVIEDGAPYSVTGNGATNSADEDDGSSDSSSSEPVKQSEAFLSWDGYTPSLLFNRSLPDLSDEDDLDYKPLDETPPTSSSEFNDGCSVSSEEVDGLLSDLRDGMNETVTAETMNLSYTVGTYARGDRTILE